MAESVIKKLGIGATISVSPMPYTVPQDGFIQLLVKAYSSSGGTYVLMADNVMAVGIYTANTKHFATGIALVKRGQIISEETKDNIRASFVNFIPLN